MHAPPTVDLTTLWGWNWATEAHKLGHEIWALVSPAHRESIDAPVTRSPALVESIGSSPRLRDGHSNRGIEPKWERTYNLLWQRAALRHARDLHRQVGFDVVHHLTWAGIRAPTFLGAPTAPLIIGPIGVGKRLRRHCVTRSA